MAYLPEEQGERAGALAFGAFVLDLRHRQLLRDDVPIRLTAKPLDVLAFLIEKRGQAVSRDQIRETVWEGTSVSDSAVEQAVTKVRKALGDDPSNPTYIHTLWGKGYVFAGDVATAEGHRLLNRNPAEGPNPPTEVGTTQSSSPTVENCDSSALQPKGFQRRHLGHLMFVSSTYAALYAVALVVETAYEFDRFGSKSVFVAILVFAWILATIGAALYVNSSRVLRDRGGRNAAIGILTAGVALLVVVVCPMLPSTTITPFSYQGHTAQAAYLKNVIYFYALGVIFALLPYDVVVSRECQSRAIGVPRPGLLFALLVGAAIWSLLSVARIFEHLLPGPHMNLYMNLLQIERVLGFGLAAECLVWYHLALARLDRGTRAT